MNNFYYEHIGHMQCCEITLAIYKNLFLLSGGKTDTPVSINDLINLTKLDGFGEKIIISEIDRFFYGGTARNLFDGNCIMTYIGLDYYNQLIKETPQQKNIIALLIRKSKRKNMYNITLQETTFFEEDTYDVIKKYCLRNGGARDFIKSISLETLNNLIIDLSKTIKNEKFDISTIKDVIDLIKQSGKYWASVGGKYSWIIFSQRYNVNVDFEKYKSLVDVMRHPTEWGHGKDIAYNDIISILDDETTLKQFIDNLIIRKLDNGNYRMTCPGYLMFERINKGYIFEFQIQKMDENKFSILACNASDVSHNEFFVEKENQTLMHLNETGTIEEIIRIINNVLENQVRMDI